MENHNPLIISEFAGTYSSFSAAIRVNPWDTREVAAAIHDALTLSDEEKLVKHLELYNYVTSNNAIYWTCSFMGELDRIALEWASQQLTTPLLQLTKMQEKMNQSRSRLFIFDYETIFKKKEVMSSSTLQPNSSRFLPIPLAATRSGSGNAESNSAIILGSLIKLIKLIQSDDQEDADIENHIFILSSQTRSVISSRFQDQPGLGLVAENGCFIQYPNCSNVHDWTELLPDTDISWREKVLEILEYYSERTPGSEIENKEICLTWNWRQADPNFG